MQESHRKSVIRAEDLRPRKSDLKADREFQHVVSSPSHPLPFPGACDTFPAIPFLPRSPSPVSPVREGRESRSQASSQTITNKIAPVYEIVASELSPHSKISQLLGNRKQRVMVNNSKKAKELGSCDDEAKELGTAVRREVQAIIGNRHLG